MEKLKNIISKLDKISDELKEMAAEKEQESPPKIKHGKQKLGIRYTFIDEAIKTHLEVVDIRSGHKYLVIGNEKGDDTMWKLMDMEDHSFIAISCLYLRLSDIEIEKRMPNWIKGCAKCWQDWRDNVWNEHCHH